MSRSLPPPTVATVVFSDVVGSTARDRRLGAEKADDLRRTHFERADDVVARLGGRIVKSLGDGLLSVFPAPSTAIEAAVAFQQLSERLGRGRADPVVLRIGISVGEISVDERGDCFGLAVVEAARLCEIAAPGEILVTQMTQQLVVSASHPFRSVGARLLKGFDASIEVSRVEWLPPVDAKPYDMTHVDADDALRPRAASFLDLIGANAHITNVRSRVLELLAPAPGQSILDVGSGTGDDVFELREHVGPTGRVVGVDISETMTSEARERARERGVDAVEFVRGDATALDFPDGTFDAGRCDRVFQYLLEPQRAMDELRRVTRPGGRVAVAETDWESAVFDIPDDGVNARISAAWTESRPNGRAGQQLYRLAKRAGLVDVVVEGKVQLKTDLDELYAHGVVPEFAKTAVDAGAVTPEEASRWIASVERAASDGTFLRAFITFIVSGRVPGGSATIAVDN